SFAKERAEQLVTSLFEGQLEDSVTCQSCGTRSARMDKFLELSLQIRELGREKPFSRLEESLNALLAEEAIDEGRECYQCDTCARKTVAVKKSSLVRVPDILAFTLKRFDLDFRNDPPMRVKLNDVFSFPMELDMSQF